MTRVKDVLKQMRNDISYFMWAMGVTGWLKAIKNFPIHGGRFLVLPWERHKGDREGCTRCAELRAEGHIDPQPDAYREPTG